MSIFNNTKALIVTGTGAGLALFSAGSVAGYFYAKKKLVVMFDEMLQNEVTATREFYKKRNKVEEFATPEDAAQHLGLEVAAATETNRSPEERQFDEAVSAMRSYRPGSDENVLEEPRTDRGKNVVHYNGVKVDPVSGETLGAVDNEPTQMIQRNVFATPPTTEVDFAYADEIGARTKDRPYIISQEEWDDNDPNHEQVEMTYYEKDAVVADPNDKPVALVEETVGRENLRFGHRSNDNDIVYVRHDTYTLDMMIVRDERSYGEHVGGFVKGTGLR